LAVAKTPFALVVPLNAALPLASDTVTFIAGVAPKAMEAPIKRKDAAALRIVFFICI
jgi:hypothetical protein